MGKCKHCEFINKTFPPASEMREREYWIFTEVFCYLHGKDECDGTDDSCECPKEEELKQLLELIVNKEGEILGFIPKKSGYFYYI